MSSDFDSAPALAAFLARHPHTLVLTGAGLSTASGIPDYRGRDGIRRGREPIQGPEFRKSAAVQRRYWARSMAGWATMAEARPNAGHVALAELELGQRIGSVLTQNVDGLHQRAGSLSVLELHGNVRTVRCLDCHATFSRAFIQTVMCEANPLLVARMASLSAEAAPDGDAHLEPDALDEFHAPFCLHCGGTLTPDVIFFGDNIPAPRTIEALARMDRADALLVVGSSLMVYSGFRFARLAAASGKPIAAINQGITRADDLIDLKVEASAELLLPRVAQLLQE